MKRYFGFCKDGLMRALNSASAHALAHALAHASARASTKASTLKSDATSTRASVLQALACAAWLAGCGPGTGGTGTGAEAGLAAASATAASVCASAFSASLNCGLGSSVSSTPPGDPSGNSSGVPVISVPGTPSDTPPAVVAPPATTTPTPAPSANLTGTAAVRFQSVASGTYLVLDFDSNSVQLDARCQRLSFIGEWGISANNDARFYGSTVTEGSLQRSAASLTVQNAAPGTGGELLVTLRTAEGRVLLGPSLLQRAAVGVLPPSGC